MNVSQLYKGFKFYTADFPNFNWFTYFAPMDIKPIHPEKDDRIPYHILIDKNERPIRVYKDELQYMLDLKLYSLEDVHKYQIKKTEEHLEYLKNNF